MPHFLKTIWPMPLRPRTLICLLLAGVLAGLTPLIAQAGKKEAKALLMARHRIGENDAHRRLQRDAMASRTSMEAVAQTIIDAGLPPQSE